MCGYTTTTTSITISPLPSAPPTLSPLHNHHCYWNHRHHNRQHLHLPTTIYTVITTFILLPTIITLTNPITTTTYPYFAGHPEASQ